MDERTRIDREIAYIDMWLFSNDWKCNKIVTGEWQTTDVRWTNYLAKRATMRARRDELVDALEALE